MLADTYGYLTDLVRRRSSMSLDERQVPWVESRLAPLARSLGEESVEALLTRMRLQGEGDLHDLVVQSVAVNETSFFRDPSTFAELAHEVLPAATARRGRSRPLRIWSAGCSSGQEPYSVAMVAHELSRDSGCVDASVLATDFCVEMVERTRLGRYSNLEVNRGLPARLLVQHMTREGAHWRVRPELAAMVTSARHNLATEPPPVDAVDVLLLRNVLIYFERDVRRRVLDSVAEVLVPGGFLVLGASESALSTHPDFARGRAGTAPWFRFEPKGSGR